MLILLINIINYFDEDLSTNIDTFILVSKFCEEYIATNGIKNDSIYWWLYQPIFRAVELRITSLLSGIDFLRKNKYSQQSDELSALVNALVNVEKLPNEDTPPKNIIPLISKNNYIIEVPELSYEYALAASSETDQKLRPAVYALVVNTRTQNVEHHEIIGLLGSDQQSLKDLAPDIQKILRNIPAIAQAKFNVPVKKFSVDLGKTTEGCSGESIGLGAFLEYLIASGLLTIDKPVAATGDMQYDGEIKRVSDINEKVDHALAAGFKLILIPKENELDLRSEFRSSDAVKVVANVKEAESSLRIYEMLKHENTNKAINELTAIKIRLRDEGFSVSEIKEGEWHYYIEVSGLNDNTKIMVYYNSKFTFKSPKVQGGKPNGALSKKLNEFISKCITSMDGGTSQGGHLTAKVRILDSADKSKIQTFLKNNFGDCLQAITENECDYRYDIVKGDKVVIKQYSNSTLYLDGFAGELWDEIILAIRAVSGIQLEVIADKEKSQPSQQLLPSGVTTWIGVDEAGKGDYFGPLVTASVLVDPSNIEQLSMLGIRDSKVLSDARNIELGEKILTICSDKCYVLVTMPEKYNELMEEPSFKKDSQRLLAWQHRRAIENILKKYECNYAICDQFGHENLIKEGLKTGKGTQIEIIQRPKAESNLAVAAASVLARKEFLLRLQKMSSEYGVSFPKGASNFDSILITARVLSEKRGKDILTKVAKVHFKTTKKIMEKL